MELHKSRSFALHQNYPNPFNSASTISYDVQKTGKVSLNIYDIYGREVAILVNGRYRQVPSQW
jgi:hypothetical protein